MVLITCFLCVRIHFLTSFVVRKDSVLVVRCYLMYRFIYRLRASSNTVEPIKNGAEQLRYAIKGVLNRALACNIAGLPDDV